jgi:hypothetical protein
MALALLLATLIGAALALLGAGGSIITVPVLVYAAGLEAHSATATSLVVVGLSAAVGGAFKWRQVDLRTAALFASLGALGAVPGAALNHRMADATVLIGFALTALAAALRMLRARTRPPRARRSPSWLATAAAALGVGVATGLFGVGGGFLIVPALRIWLGMEMRAAVATSLVVIAVNAAAALATHAGAGELIAWRLGLEVAAAALVGGALSAPLAWRLDERALGTAFAALLLIVSVAMLADGARALLR